MHAMLPRALGQLAMANPGSNQEEEELIKLFEDEDISNDDFSGKDKQWEDMLVSVLKSEELSPAELNQKRKQLTFETFRDPNFVDKTLMLDFLMAPLVDGMDGFLLRSGNISKLHLIPRGLDEKAFLDAQHRPDVKTNKSIHWCFV